MPTIRPAHQLRCCNQTPRLQQQRQQHNHLFERTSICAKFLPIQSRGAKVNGENRVVLGLYALVPVTNTMINRRIGKTAIALLPALFSLTHTQTNVLEHLTMPQLILTPCANHNTTHHGTVKDEGEVDEQICIPSPFDNKDETPPTVR